MNLYAFVRNNSIDAWDKLGRLPGVAYASRYEAFRDASRAVIGATDASAEKGIAEVEDSKKNIIIVVNMFPPFAVTKILLFRFQEP